MEVPVARAVRFVKEIFRCYIRFGHWVIRTARNILPFIRKRKGVLGIVKYGIFLFLIVVVALSLAPLLPIPGNFKSLVVMSGSMEPAIHTGSVAFIKSTESVQVGDIVTFKNPSDPQENFTHRIVEVGENEIIKTKGDANDSPDSWELTKDDIVGKFLLSIPLLGYAVYFAKTPRGFILLIILPAILIILDELRTIKSELEKKYAEKYAKNLKIAAALIFLFGTAAFALGATRAYFSDTKTSTGNQLAAGTWGPKIVINEFMPDPKVVDDDNGEWFEIYNAGDESENLNGWEIKDDNGDSHIIGGDLIVAADSYAVLCRNDDMGTNGGLACDYEYSGFQLANATDEIILKDGGGNEKDRVEYTDEFPYDEGYSAELKDTSLDNNNKDNWEKADDADTYGDGDHGTPAASN